ncbi:MULTISPECIES: phosphate ABC transporter permease subunit PstC [Anaerococcus]|uniref:Phosphate transport system permease protein n=1 Tax=Anaerococcus nagyae TaxID=1755241 RepID=A0A3E2THB3_9FIRM|nr:MULTISPECIES: phosphate ABC transporter permease subunit PstC [Anaerococcus]MBP2069857.1 phosphate transport system permease protein [Anaerococcus nagyae]MDU1827898.1 phosphate ABC transporter permease subunit PstC [Anaerococcus sp.]MDU1863757.1 phosphate ABC transporter permease subunit PstC [Anaerococcus sp.]MDU2565709.1 phosphate ABC transporter permease subunit PstC [Anaerococcus sp.]MDU3211418.1 phosphate ABC transporter permease subunit PstC [Anaerococcus sp.]
MKNTKERFGEILFLISAAMSVVLILLIIFFIFRSGIDFVSKYGLVPFITGTKWAPKAKPASFGILPMIVGSVIVTLVSTLIALPFGLAVSVFMAYYADKSYGFLKSLINLMAAIPSVVYGFFAMVKLAPIVGKVFHTRQYNMLTASILLSIMILPTMVNISENSLRQVPKTFYTGSLALGATKEETIHKVMIPYAKSGIFSSIILAIGRAIGETMAVYLVVGNQPRMPKSILQGARTLTTNIVLEMGYASGMHRQSLIATGMVLFFFILLINIIFNIIRDKNQDKY